MKNVNIIQIRNILTYLYYILTPQIFKIRLIFILLTVNLDFHSVIGVVYEYHN